MWLYIKDLYCQLFMVVVDIVANLAMVCLLFGNVLCVTDSVLMSEISE